MRAVLSPEDRAAEIKSASTAMDIELDYARSSRRSSCAVRRTSPASRARYWRALDESTEPDGLTLWCGGLASWHAR